MLWFLILVAWVCEVWAGPLEKQKASEIENDEGYINSLIGNHQVPKHSETLLDYADDYAVQEGDILIPNDRNAASTLWPEIGGNVSVPYEINVALEDRRYHIFEAFNMISEKTCVKFHRHTNETNYLNFNPSESCASYVGCVGGEQPVLVGPQCRVGNICHEILHSLGLYHEHSRHDRGKYINILYENIASGKEENFLVKDGNTLGLEYDLQSILHYGNNYFSRNGKPTIMSKDGTTKIGQRSRMSNLDVQRLRKLYQCDKRENEVTST